MTHGTSWFHISIPPRLAALAVIIVLSALALPAAMADGTPTVTVESVKPNKVLYLFNEEANAAITLRNHTDRTQKGELLVSEEWDLTDSREIALLPVEVQPGESKVVAVKWNTGTAMYGRALRAAFRQGGKVVAQGAEFYQVADPKEWLRCFMINGGGGADYPAFKTDPFVTYNNFDNHFAYMLSGFSHLAPKEDEWVGGQFTIRWNKKEMIEGINARKSIGVRAGAYTIGATGGPAGYEMARQHPEWFLRTKKGAFLIPYEAPVSPTEVARKTSEPLGSWYALIPDFGNPEVVQYGGEEIVRAIKMFGWDAVFFDGIYGVQLEGSSLSGYYTWDGKPATRSEGADKLSTECVRKVQEIIHSAYPNVALWYNGSGPRPSDPVKEAHKASLQDRNCGTLLEIQGAQMANPNFHGHQWRTLYEIYVSERNALLKEKDLDDPVLATGYTYNLDPRSLMTKEEFEATRDTWATANHLGTIIMAARIHPCVLASTGFRPVTQFMTRYSALLWARDVKWVKEPWKIIEVDSNRELWWEEGVYTREGKDYRDTLVHLVNSPDQEDFDLKLAKDPDPVQHVEVTFSLTGDPRKARVYALQMYGYGSAVKQPTQVELKTKIEGRKLKVETPPFSYHTLVVLRQRKA